MASDKPLEAVNVLLVIVDALRRDRLGVYGFNGGVTPVMDKLASRGVVFSNAFSTTNATDPSLTSMWTGRYPTSHGIVHHGHLVKPEETARASRIAFIQELLLQRGYTTFAVDFLGRWHRRGFAYYGYGRRRRIPQLVLSVLGRALPRRVRAVARRLLEATAAGRDLVAKPYTAMDATRHALYMIRRLQGKMFFGVIHYWDTHVPYSADPGLWEKLAKRYRGGVYDITLGELAENIKGPWRNSLLNMFSPELTVGEVVAMYDASIARVDRAIGVLVQGLEDAGLADETLLIITSDHGESLVEHEIYFDHHGLYDVSVRVPLILYGAGLPKGRIYEVHVQHVDLVPTILEIAGAKEKPYTEGKSLLPLLSGSAQDEPNALRSYVYLEEAHTERKFAIRDSRYKYIMAASPSQALCRYCGIIHGGIEELYDLKRDPREERNLVEELPDIVKEYKVTLKRYIARLTMRESVDRIKSRLLVRRSE